MVEERGADPSMANVPGGKTGLLVHQIKSIGNGPNAKIVPEYVVDTARFGNCEPRPSKQLKSSVGGKNLTMRSRKHRNPHSLPKGSHKVVLLDLLAVAYLRKV